MGRHVRQAAMGLLRSHPPAHLPRVQRARRVRAGSNPRSHDGGVGRCPRARTHGWTPGGPQRRTTGVAAHPCEGPKQLAGRHLCDARDLAYQLLSVPQQARAADRQAGDSGLLAAVPSPQAAAEVVYLADGHAHGEPARSTVESAAQAIAASGTEATYPTGRQRRVATTDRDPAGRQEEVKRRTVRDGFARGEPC